MSGSRPKGGGWPVLVENSTSCETLLKVWSCSTTAVNSSPCTGSMRLLNLANLGKNKKHICVWLQDLKESLYIKNDDYLLFQGWLLMLRMIAREALTELREFSSPLRLASVLSVSN